MALELGAEVVEMPLGRIIKEMYIEDEGVIVIDPNIIGNYGFYNFSGLRLHIYKPSLRMDNFIFRLNSILIHIICGV